MVAGTLESLLVVVIRGGSVMNIMSTPLGWIFLFAESNIRFNRLGLERLMFPCKQLILQGHPILSLLDESVAI